MPSPVILEGTPGDETLEAAGDALSAFLSAISARAGASIRAERREIGARLRAARAEGEPADALLADRAACARILRRLHRIALRPGLEARRQARRLGTMVRRGAFASVRIERARVEARVEALGPGGDGYTIVLPLDEPECFPAMIRQDSRGMEPTFLRFGLHPTCWGEARGLLEAATEKASVEDLLLVGASWAGTNLGTGR